MGERNQPIFPEFCQFRGSDDFLLSSGLVLLSTRARYAMLHSPACWAFVSKIYIQFVKNTQIIMYQKKKTQLKICSRLVCYCNDFLLSTSDRNALLHLTACWAFGINDMYITT